MIASIQYSAGKLEEMINIILQQLVWLYLKSLCPAAQLWEACRLVFLAHFGGARHMGHVAGHLHEWLLNH